MYNLPERILEEMEGIQYVTNDKGERVAVQIDLRKYGDLWEDVYDTLIARKRAKEPRESLDSVKKRLIKQSKLNG
jgi:RNase adaptor protein for sRNA GlmZ degradation